MVYLVIKITAETHEEIKKYAGILDAWDLAIVERDFDRQQSATRIAINATTPAAMNLVVSIAQSRFQQHLLASKMEYEPA
jgi:hypothetical protein